MLPYFGNHSCKQFIRGKPVRFGFKTWALCCEHGFPFYIDVYQGKSISYEDENGESKYGPIGMGGRVVKKAVQTALDDPSSHALYTDNFFTSYALLRDFSDVGLRHTGTMKMNRTNSCPLLNKHDMTKKERGYFQHASDGNVLCVTWKDNAVVVIGSNYDGVTPTLTIERHKKGGSVTTQQPKVVQDYNRFMGGVDLSDRHLSNLRSTVRKRAWYWPVVKHCFEMIRVAAFVMYR